ncbi:MAG: hypothetical protein OSJ73_14980 [Lachnospiraceae bacterium]|jgi:hypothetical protein|nr:hypothetical protein [Lachnospiraceae bacterium]
MMSIEKLFVQTIMCLVSNPKNFTEIVDKELSLPNIPYKVYDGEVFWTTLAEYNGWKLQ